MMLNTVTDYEHLFWGIFNHTRASAVVINQRLQVVAANRNFLAKSRRSEEDAIGSRLEDVFPQVLINYIGLPDKVRAVFRRSSTPDGKMTYRAPGLPLRIYYYSLTPIFDNHNNVEYVLLLMYDVTEQERLNEEVRRAERHLVSVVQSASDLVVSLDSNEQILSWNLAAERISHYRLDAILRKPLHLLCAPWSQEAISNAVRRLAEGGHPETVESDLVTAEGRWVPVAWAFSGMHDEAGGIVGIVGVGRDLTLRRQLEELRLQTAKMASLGVMAGGIAHEIRNPLGICSGAAQLMLKAPDNQELQQQCARQIYENIQRASTVIENLLKFARPADTQFRPVNINTVVHEALALVDSQVRDGHIRVTFQQCPEPVTVDGSPGLLHQVFANLILNGCQSMHEDGRLTIIIGSDDKWITVTVSDTGCGIPAEDIDKVFDPFYTTKPVGQGVGLGLPICYSVIHQHGGTISASSQQGVGSTFTVKLPVKDVETNGNGKP